MAKTSTKKPTTPKTAAKKPARAKSTAKPAKTTRSATASKSSAAKTKRQSTSAVKATASKAATARSTTAKPGAPIPTPRPAAYAVASVSRPSADASAAKPAPLSAETGDVARVVLDRNALIQRIVTKSDIKKKYAKPVIEALLEELGDAIARGDSLKLRPFGNLEVLREKDRENVNVYVCKLRRSKSYTRPEPTLAGAID